MTAVQNPAANQERFAFIHLLRGLAALLVVWSHLSGFWLLSNGSSSLLQEYWQQLIVVPFHVFQNGGHLGVILFFLISGYIITHTALREDRWSFTVKRTLRIFPPLIFATVVTWVFFQVAHATETTLIGVNGGGLWHWLSATVLLDGFIPGGVRALDVTWTLVIELYFYIFSFAVINLTKRAPLRSVWYMTAMWVALILASRFFGFLSINGDLAVYVGFLILGRIIYLAQQRRIKTFDALVVGALVALIFLLSMETMSPGFLLTPGGWSGVEPLATYAYALIIFLAMMRLAPKRAIQPFGLLGDISYSLYLLHIPVGITVLNLLASTGVPNSFNILIAIGASLIAAWLSYRFVEVPFQRLARQILKTRKSTLSSQELGDSPRAHDSALPLAQAPSPVPPHQAEN